MEKDTVNQAIRFVAKILKFESYPDAETNTSLVGTNGRGCERIVVVAAEPEEARGFESFLQHCFWLGSVNQNGDSNSMEKLLNEEIALSTST